MQRNTLTNPQDKVQEQAHQPKLILLFFLTQHPNSFPLPLQENPLYLAKQDKERIARGEIVAAKKGKKK